MVPVLSFTLQHTLPCLIAPTHPVPLTAVEKPAKTQEATAKRLSSEICKAFPKDEAVSMTTAHHI